MITPSRRAHPEVQRRRCAPTVAAVPRGAAAKLWVCPGLCGPVIQPGSGMGQSGVHPSGLLVFATVSLSTGSCSVARRQTASHTQLPPPDSGWLRQSSDPPWCLLSSALRLCVDGVVERTASSSRCSSCASPRSISSALSSGACWCVIPPESPSQPRTENVNRAMRRLLLSFQQLVPLGELSAAQHRTRPDVRLVAHQNSTS